MANNVPTSALAHSLQILQDYLTSLAANEIFSTSLTPAFGSVFDTATAAIFQQQWLTDRFNGLPVIEVIPPVQQGDNAIALSIQEQTFTEAASIVNDEFTFAPVMEKERITPFEAVYENLSLLGETHDQGDHFEAFQTPTRWSSTATNGSSLQEGDPTTITWSVVADGTAIPGFSGEPDANSNLQAFFNGIYGTPANWLSIFTNVFDRWSALSGVNYVYESNDDGEAFSNYSSAAPGVLGTRGDVRIGGHYIDGQSGANTLAYNFFPSNGEMVIDTSNTTFYSDVSNNSLRVRNTLAHELGHGLGLSHVESDNAKFLLEPFISVAFDGPQFDVIVGVHRLYGDAFESSAGNHLESNDSISSATDLGTVMSGMTVSIGTDASDISTVIAATQTDFVSIDDDSDTDFYRFTITSPSSIDIILNPRGPTYNEGPQGGSQPPLNTKALNNLSLAVFNSSSELSRANNTAAGSSEHITGLQLTTGTYYVRVTGSENNVQLYDLNISASATTPPSKTLIGGADNDRLYGEAGNDDLRGYAGNDYLRGDAGADKLDGGDGSDTIEYITSDAGVTINLTNNTARGGHATGDTIANIERVYGSNFNDTLTGDAGRNILIGRNGSDRLYGEAGNDDLRGYAGNDTLIGGTGSRDTLTGGSGSDVFLFSTLTEAGDAITDFISGTDTLEIIAAGFGGGLQVGVPSAVQFVLGAAAQDSESRFIYNRGTGTLFFDADGLGGSNQIELVVLTSSPSLTANDISII